MRWISARQDDVCAQVGEFFRHRQAEAGSSARDDGGPSFQGFIFDHGVSCRPTTSGDKARRACLLRIFSV